jgi:FKBP-type peptidyl-prolyl cis-trans isomerase
MKRALTLVLLLALPLFAADMPAPPADLNAPPADAERGEEGLITKKLVAGSGTARPAKDDLVRVRYTVWKEDGTLVQHVPEGRSAVIAVPKLIPGWGKAVMLMVAGEQRRAWVPYQLTGGKSDLGMVFDTELLEIIPYPQTPVDVAAPPADATKTPSGLAYKVLRAGSEGKKPSRGSTVVVHYSGWTTDGRMFDSSVTRGEPTTFALTDVIKGWTEGLQLMQVGEKTRFWIPAKLAYGNKAGAPQGMLVFDVELIAIK